MARRLACVLALGLLGAGRADVDRVGEWNSHGPYGGYVLGLDTSPSDASTLFAGVSRALFRSDDAGHSWNRVDLGGETPNLGVCQTLVSPSNPLVIYAVTNSYLVTSSRQSLIRSADGGRTWREMLSIDNLGCFHASIDPASEAVYVAPINSYALRVGEGDPTILIDNTGSIVVDPVVPSVLYANRSDDDGNGGYVNQIYRSLDRGARWAPLGPSGVVISAVDPANHVILYSIGEEFRRSDDGGATWKPSASAPSPIREFVFGEGSVPPIYVLSFDSRLFRSLDRGTTWVELGTPAVPLETVVFLEASGGQICGGAGGAGVFCSSDEGSTWSSRNQGLNAATVSAVTLAPSNPRIVYALGPMFSASEDAGATWSVEVHPPTSPTGDVAVDPGDSSAIFASGQTAGVLRSMDGGATWSSTAPVENHVKSIAIDPASPGTLYAAGGRLWKSTDGGDAWNDIGTGLPESAELVVVDASNSQVLYAAAPTLFRSTDAGASWSQVDGRAVSSVASDPAHPGTVYAATFYGVLKSLDYGASWSTTGLFGDTTPNKLTCDARGFVYASGYYSAPQLAGAGNELLFSVDGGASWEPVGGRPSHPLEFPAMIYGLAVDYPGSRLYAATNMGVWILPLRAPRSLSERTP